MSVTPGPVAIAVRRSRNGRSAAVPGIEHGVHVADEQDPRPAGRPCDVPIDRVAERPAGSGRRSTSAPISLQEPRDERPDLVDALGRVGAAVDVDERARSAR